MDAKVFPDGRDVRHVDASPTLRSLGEVIRQSDKTLTIESDEGSELASVGPKRAKGVGILGPPVYLDAGRSYG